jgi:hypothetical protein
VSLGASKADWLAIKPRNIPTGVVLETNESAQKKGPRHCRSPHEVTFAFKLELLVFLDLKFSIDDIVIIRLG